MEVEAEEGSTHWKAVTAGWAPGAEKGSRAGRKRACRGTPHFGSKAKVPQVRR